MSAPRAAERLGAKEARMLKLKSCRLMERKEVLAWEKIPGNEWAKRAIEVAAVQRHSVALIYHDRLIAESLREYAKRLGVDVLLVKPCPCGNLGDRAHFCDCRPSQIKRHRESALWRIAMRRPVKVLVLRPEAFELVRMLDGAQGESFEAMEKRVKEARGQVPARFSQDALKLVEIAQRQAELDTEMLRHMAELAKSVAALVGADKVGPEHVAEAFQFVKVDI